MSAPGPAPHSLAVCGRDCSLDSTLCSKYGKDGCLTCDSSTKLCVKGLLDGLRQWLSQQPATVRYAIYASPAVLLLLIILMVVAYKRLRQRRQ